MVKNIEEMKAVEDGGKRHHIDVTEPVCYRWEPYKKDGQRQMKAKGRWQRQFLSGDFVKWQNCEREEVVAAVMRQRPESEFESLCKSILDRRDMYFELKEKLSVAIPPNSDSMNMINLCIEELTHIKSTIEELKAIKEQLAAGGDR